MESNELKEGHTKNFTCYYFDDIINIEDFNFDNILIDEKYHYETQYVFFFDKNKELLEKYNET